MQAIKFNSQQAKYTYEVTGNETFKVCEIFLQAGRKGCMMTQEGKSLKIKTDASGNEFVELKGMSGKLVVKAS
jgi:hypothetical protein